MSLRDQVLSEIADLMLAAVPRDQHPHYQERTMQRKQIRQERACLNNVERFRLFHDRDTGLLLHEWEEIVTDANLTDTQTDVLTQRLQGESFEAIGEKRGHTKQGAQRIFSQAKAKLVRAYARYPFRGLSQVYNEEMARLDSRPGAHGR
jgi:hypothetical protein